jgi:hypothetical protein
MAAVAELGFRAAAAISGARVTGRAQAQGGASAKHAKGGGIARPLRCVAEGATPAAAATSGTPVRKTSMLIIGATGTLGRQVRPTLDLELY